MSNENRVEKKKGRRGEEKKKGGRGEERKGEEMRSGKERTSGK